MTENAHTPGPWRVAFETRIEYGPFVAGKGYAVAEVFLDPAETGNPQEWKANARLIAAAPEMLEALESALVRLKEYEIVNDFHHPLVRQLTRAIAKARG